MPRAIGIGLGIPFGSGLRAPNGLLTSLISCWQLDEASGDALDSHTNGYTATETNGPITAGTGPGGVGGSRTFSSTSSQYFTRADNANLSTGNNDFAISYWVKFTTLGSSRTVISKYVGAGAREYYTGWDATASRFQFAVRTSGDGSTTTVNASTFGALSTATWYFVVCNHDSVGDTIGISVNAGTEDQNAFAGGPPDSTGPVCIGSLSGTTNYLNGSAAGVCFWKGRTLNATARTTLYNGGLLLPYSSFTA